MRVISDVSQIQLQKMKNVSVLLLLLVCTAYAQAYELSMFYCGFSGDFCGQSNTDDVNPKAKFIILAFANTNPDGTITVDHVNFPTNLVRGWQSKGKKVLISIGGQNGNWDYVFASSTSINNFAASLDKAIKYFKLDGVDLDIEGYHAAPKTVANAIITLRSKIGKGKLIIVSPENVAVYQGAPVPDANIGGVAFNYFVNVIRLADHAIDYYQPQAYNNWYGEPAGTLNYLQNTYLNWRNLKGTGKWDNPIPNFKGVAGNKLLMGVLASTSAGGAAHYMSPDVISQFKGWLRTRGYPLRGFMMWDSNWDKLNNFAISTVCTA